ncbi:hypothetical protein C8039_15170 [Halogeometricum sp. wsp3]|nr:hypothetical protein C8039_15170 [Halogeometricum sp. wsp3]
MVRRDVPSLERSERRSTLRSQNASRSYFEYVASYPSARPFQSQPIRLLDRPQEGLTARLRTTADGFANERSH